MNECKFYLVRHGQSIANFNRVYLGQTDLDLSEIGYKQAEITANYLKDVKFDKIYSSDLKRAHNTAVPHAKMRGLEVIDSKELREIFLGDWENQKIDDLVKNYPDEFLIGWKKNYGTFTVPGGERVLDAGKRFLSEVKRIAEENIGKTVLITAHAAVIRSFWSIISGIKPEDVAEAINFPTNASYSTFIYRDGFFYPDKYSCDEQFSETEKTRLYEA